MIGQMDQQTSFYHYSCALAVKMRYITYITSKEAQRSVKIHERGKRRKEARSRTLLGLVLPGGARDRKQCGA